MDNGIFLDDLRGAPIGWKLTRTVKEFCKELRAGNYEIASLDYDLDDPHCSGTFAASEIIYLYQTGKCSLKKIILHSANDYGRVEMKKKLMRHTKLEVVEQPLEQSSIADYL